MFAERLTRLGTETAFAVSQEAAALKAKGKVIFPFHLGDINIRTPDNIIAAAHKALLDGKTGYCSNAGIVELRDALAFDINATHGTRYSADNIAIQPGGKPVIGKFIMTLMNPGDEVLYPNPGYPIYESMIEFHGGVGLPYSYREVDGQYRLDVESLEKSITPRTRLLIYNDLHNPSGAESTPEEMQQIAEIVRKYNLYVLCDEAYFDMRYEGKSRSLVSLPDMVERCVILYTFSKRFAMTGWRLGAAIGPKSIIDWIAKLNLNDESCTAHFIQHAAIEGLTGDQAGVRQIVQTLKARRDTAVDRLNSIPGIKCLKPQATFYLFPNATEAMAIKGISDYEKFRRDVLHTTGVSFCTRLHFGRALPGENQRYLRFAYSGIDMAMIEEGLGRFKAYMES